MTTSNWEPDEFRLIIGRTRVDYDSEKEETNRRKHGYSLESATHVLSRLLLPVAQPPFVTRDASTLEERRHEHMTVDDHGRVVFLVTTMRDDETVRVISFRRAHADQRKEFSVLTGFVEQS